MFEKVGDRLDDRRAEEHPGLGGIDAEVGKEDVELSADEIWRRLVDRAHFRRRLGRQGDDRAHAVAAEPGEGLQVGLDPGPAARIGGRDRETARYHSA